MMENKSGEVVVTISGEEKLLKNATPGTLRDAKPRVTGNRADEEKWIPIIKEQWLTFVTNMEPHARKHTTLKLRSLQIHMSLNKAHVFIKRYSKKFFRGYRSREQSVRQKKNGTFSSLLSWRLLSFLVDLAVYSPTDCRSLVVFTRRPCPSLRRCLVLFCRPFTSRSRSYLETVCMGS
ncbi:hypothetical protein L2E82_30202 [Cichorium intybus]|uniref:Uncharacterized protein n=1 Tax=Cichorium intybus TaxID=13427 RepID=A0ACB9CZY7_CICIN|nr:hypothetical protein L2E82_30202 [Cichorium intybus]